MSAIFGMYSRTGQPVDIEKATRLGNDCQHRGPDGMSLWCHEVVALGRQLLCTTTESLKEKGEAVFRQNNVAITGDVRVDNRSSLAERLGLHSSKAFLCSDSALILLAYRKWGTECFKEILGDFAIVIWDGDDQKIVCARDIIGVKPLYYHLSPRQFLFCSEIKPLLFTNIFPIRPSEASVAEHLTGLFVSQQETLYEHVSRLEPGTCLVIRPKKYAFQKYWSPLYNSFRRYKKEQEYVDEFRDIFSKAVRCRLRSHLPVSVELSGGLDSSSIAAEAVREHIAGRVALPRFYANIFSGLACDEEYYIRLVQNCLRIQCNCIPYRKDLQIHLDHLTRENYELPDPPNITNNAEMLQQMNAAGSRVVISGIGGDEWFTGSEYPYLDLLLQGKVAELRKEFSRRYQINRIRTIKGLGYSIAWPLLPELLRKAILTRRQQRLPDVPWVSARLLTKSRDNIRSAVDKAGVVGNPALQPLYAILQQGNESRILEINDRVRARFNLEVRHPFLDRRMIEFALALPEDMRRKQGWTKYVMRKALSGILPTEIVWRKDKAEFSDLFYELFQSQLYRSGALLQPQVSEWLNGDRFFQEFDSNLSSYRLAGNASFPRVWLVWFAIALSTWYTTIQPFET